jgi:hypothetical protein
VAPAQIELSGGLGTIYELGTAVLISEHLTNGLRPQKIEPAENKLLKAGTTGVTNNSSNSFWPLVNSSAKLILCLLGTLMYPEVLNFSVDSTQVDHQKLSLSTKKLSRNTLTVLQSRIVLDPQ